MSHDVVDQPFQKHQHVWFACAVRMDRQWEHGVIERAVNPVELILPYLFELASGDPSMAIWKRFNKRDRRDVIEMPTRRKLDKVDLLASAPRLHPVLGF